MIWLELEALRFSLSEYSSQKLWSWMANRTRRPWKWITSFSASVR